MAAPTVNGTASGASGTSNVYTFDVTMPAGIVAGERLVTFFSMDDANQTSVWIDEDYSGPGWEIIGNALYAFTVKGVVLTKVAEGGSPATDRLRIKCRSAEQASWITYRISAANCIDCTSSNGNSTNSDPPNHTLTADETSPPPDVLWLASRHGDSTTTASAAPSGYSSLQTQAASGTGGASTNVAEKSVSGDYEEDPGTFTSNTEQWVCFTVAVYNANEAEARVTQLLVEVASQGYLAPGGAGQPAQQFIVAT